MPRRPAFATTTAALCALTALTACQNSPEAGHPNTTPTSTSAPSASTPTPTATPPTPAWTAEEQAAISAAKTRYVVARAAIDAALNNPPAATEAKLLEAGAGGKWLGQVLTDVQFNQERGWYQDGKASIEGITVAAVKLKAEQPEVRLNACLDTSKLTLRYQATRRPVPVGPGTARRHKVQAQIVYTAAVGQSKKMWFFINETDLGSC